jgi:hypothetical protein
MIDSTKIQTNESEREMSCRCIVSHILVSIIYDGEKQFRAMFGNEVNEINGRVIGKTLMRCCDTEVGLVVEKAEESSISPCSMYIILNEFVE